MTMTDETTTREESEDHAPRQSALPDPADQNPVRKSRTNPYSHLFRILHWILPVTMAVGIVTGVSLHTVARPEWSLSSGVMPSWLLGGRVQVFHLMAAVVTSAGVVAALCLYIRRKTKRRAIHVILCASGLALVATGLIMLQPPTPAWIYTLSRTLHFTVGLVILPIALLCHVGEGIFRFPRFLIPAFHPWATPQLKQFVAFAMLLLVSAAFIFNVLPRSLAGRQLIAKRVSDTGSDLETLPWDKAEPLAIQLADGVGFDHGRTQVTLQALHNGEDLFVRACWADPTEDRQYQPWLKTEEGWQQLVTIGNDESYYYEDKFSLVFPTKSDWQFDKLGCAAACHAGVGEGHAYGCKGYRTVIDVWHWKATRADPVGQIDDKYWSILEPGGPGGRHGDPKDGGGYKKNAPKEGKHPAFLPATANAVSKGGIYADQAVPYESQQAAELLADMPEGTIVPGIIFSPFEGDRGDVQCRSTHKDGQWEVLIRRKLDTGSEYDTKFAPGRTHSFACAAFDHSSKRHAYGFDTFALTLEP